jgi:glycosyltransferase involved in cell wall biosynthesis
MIINQWVPAAHRGDAIGDSARRVRDMLRAAGHDSDLYALTIDEDVREDVRPFSDAGARQGHITIFHFALPSPMTEAFASLSGIRVLQYHNITPARFFGPYDAQMFRLAALGRQELRSLADRVDLGLGDSEFNRQELEALGFPRTGVMPIAVNMERLTSAPRRPALEKILGGDGFINFLFVGRIVPNKRIEDHIRLAEMYKRYIDSYYRFIFVGRHDGLPRYYSMIRALIVQYRMLPERFIFTGAVPDDDLAAYYRWADAYISLSEHEGFCVPLVEAMATDVPVLAYAAGAVPETLGGAGVLFSPKDIEFAAEMLGTLVYDRPVRDRIISGQRRRVRDFAPDRIEQRLKEVLATLGV